MNQKQARNVPESLITTQEWFGSIIANRLGKDNAIAATTPKGKKIVDEAARFIAPSPTLKPHQRIQIYNQQYWWRLLKVLHESFPLVTRLFGYSDFNEKIAVPYLLTYPPNDWSLNTVGERLPMWVKKHYKAPDQPLVYDAATADWTYCAGFLAPNLPPLDLTLLADDLLSRIFYVQPYLDLFQFSYHLLNFRDAFLKEEVDYWTEHDFPSLVKDHTYYFIIYRSAKNNMHWKEVSAGEYTLLSLLKQGCSIEAACAQLEQDATVYEQAEKHLQTWLQEFVSRGWLTLTSN